jgi:hypothetical protein
MTKLAKFNVLVFCSVLGGCGSFTQNKVDLLMEASAVAGRETLAMELASAGFDVVSQRIGEDQLPAFFTQNKKLNIEVVLLPFFQCESKIKIVNNGDSVVKVNWSDSYLKFANSINKPVPATQALSAGAVAPQQAAPTMVPSKSEFSDVIVSLNRLSTQTSYTTIYQGHVPIGQVASGTYISNSKTYPCQFEDYTRRESIPSEIPGKKSSSEPIEAWKARVEQAALQEYGSKPSEFFLSLEVDDKKIKIPFYFSLKSARGKTGAEIDSENAKKKKKSN